MTPPEPALPHRPTAPQRPGERDGERPTVPPWLPPPPSSSAPSSPSDNGSTGKWPNPGGPHSPRPGGHLPQLPPPQPWDSGQPHWKGGSWQRAGAGNPHLHCPPRSDLTWLPPPALGSALGPLQGRAGGAVKVRPPPNALDLCSGPATTLGNPLCPPSPG